MIDEGIKKDFGSAAIIDYSGNNREQLIVFTCEHSSNKMPGSIGWRKEDEHFEEMHWAYDIGALDLSKSLSAHFKTYLLYAKYSRILLDVNRVVLNTSMFRENTGKGGEIVKMNEKMSVEEKVQRMRDYWLPYYQEIVNKVNYKYIFSIHSFSEKEDSELKTLEVGILHNLFDGLADFFLKEFTSRGYIAMINEPYNGKLGGNHSQNNSIGFEIDPDRQGILFEFRNDLLTDPVRGAKLEKDVKEILEKLIATEPTKQPPLKPKELKPTGPVVKFKESINYIAVSYNKEPKVRLCFIAEHAGHSLPGSLGWSESDEKNIVSRNLHYARNTFELADYLAQQFETSFIATKLSKLVVDPNKQLTSPTIFPKVIYGVPVELNSLMTYEQESERYERYFLDLMSGVIYLHNIISSHFWFSIQSFPDFHLPQTDLILSFYTNEKFAEKMKKSFEKKGYSVLMNHKDFDGNQLFGYTNTTFLNGMYPRKRESLIFVFSSKLLDHHLDKLKEDFSELIRFRCIKDE